MDSIDKYVKLTYERPELFAKKGVHIYKDAKVLRNYARKHNITLGVTHDSDYRMMLVDLIKDSSGRVYPYERLIEKGGNGVIIIPFVKGNMILLSQYRWITDDNQLCFPRGFGIEGKSDKESAIREIEEELKCTPISIEKIASFKANDGLTPARISVYVASLPEDFATDNGYEGIRTMRSITRGDFVKLSGQGIIDDALTLAAYACASTSEEAQEEDENMKKLAHLNRCVMEKGYGDKYRYCYNCKFRNHGDCEKDARKWILEEKMKKSDYETGDYFSPEADTKQDDVSAPAEESINE